jgi:hypothetical protein
LPLQLVNRVQKRIFATTVALCREADIATVVRIT